MCSSDLSPILQNYKQEMSDFYEQFFGYYGIPVQMAPPPPIPSHPGVSLQRPLPIIPFHSRPTSSMHLSPAPIPVPPFDPLPVTVRTRLPVVESSMVSPSSLVSISFSGYDVVNPVSLEGQVPPFPKPFAAAYQQCDYNLDVEHQELDIVMDPQEQMMNAFNWHINTTNDILNRLVNHMANPPAPTPQPTHTPLLQPLPAFATTSHTPKKYIALPEPFDGNQELEGVQGTMPHVFDCQCRCLCYRV